MRFAADLGRVPACRHWAVELARAEGASEHALRLVALLTTEAATNAVRHGPPGGEVRLELVRRGDRVRISVRDASPSLPVVKHVEPSSPGGRGVMLIDVLSGDWGVEQESGGTKTVWFEVPLAAEGPDLG
ncbi:ATP-binding protein [Actinotalea ferrariae]|uniref:ATP-binding protein n=1 Tax=Actinotalea ferrariae TaxID=1386098 RepID=UPI001C8C6B43|nr:ATP-binding protein [Actinotalea ferrariae]MBX9245236.1 ATP-binding protein [Actinotalea ferrariae]